MNDDLKLKHERLQIAIAELDKKYGGGTVIRVGNEDIPKIPHIPTGALTLDQAIGLGGFPLGRIVELYGAESSGKTTLALSVVANAQKAGLTCLYVDAEQSLDPVYAQTIGINMDELLLSQPDYGEAAFEIIERMVRSEEVDIVIVDSVAALTPKAELDGDMEQSHMGIQARMMAKGLRKINGLLSSGDKKTMIVFINQLREKIGVMFGNPETTPGGRSLKFYASLRIDLRKEESLKDKLTGNYIGNRVRANIVKNKVGPPLRKAHFDIIYGVGVDEYGCVVDLAIERGVFKKSGAGWIKYNDETFAQGRDNAVEKLKDDDVLYEKIKGEVL